MYQQQHSRANRWLISSKSFSCNSNARFVFLCYHDTDNIHLRTNVSHVDPKLRQRWANVLSRLGIVVLCKVANTQHWAIVWSMLVHRLRRWPNIHQTMGECRVLAVQVADCLSLLILSLADGLRMKESVQRVANTRISDDDHIGFLERGTWRTNMTLLMVHLTHISRWSEHDDRIRRTHDIMNSNLGNSYEIRFILLRGTHQVGLKSTLYLLITTIVVLNSFY